MANWLPPRNPVEEGLRNLLARLGVPEAMNRAQEALPDSLRAILSRVRYSPDLFPTPMQVNYLTPAAMRTGQAGMSMLPERVRQFLLRTPEQVNVGTEAIAGAEGMFRPAFGGGPHQIMLRAGTHPSTAAEEFLHAADFLGTGGRAGQAATETVRGAGYGSIMGSEPVRQRMEAFAMPTRAMDPQAYGGNIAAAALEDRGLREALLRGLEAIPRVP